MQFKRFLSLLASATMAVTALTGAMTASAVEADGKLGTNLTWKLVDGVLTISGTGEMVSPEVTVTETPSDVNSYSDVYTYKEYAEEVEKVIVDEDVTSIGFAAFYKFPNLETVVLPSTINKFGGYGSFNYAYDDFNYAFAECTSLKNVTLTEGMTAIGAYAFYKCTSIEKIEIPSSIAIANWGRYSFSECTSLKDITLPEGLEVIGSRAFANTAVESIVIPSTIKSWPDYVHKNKAVPSMGSYANEAFAYCQNLTSVTLTDGLTKLINAPFYMCENLEKLCIPKSVTDINYGLAGIPGLKEAYIEEGTEMTEMKDRAFYYSENLERLEIPAGIEIDKSGANWLEGCSGLKDLYIHDKNCGVIPTGNATSKIHCYDGTTTYSSLTKAGVMGFRIVYLDSDIKAAKRTLDKAVATAEKYSEEDYTAESYGALKALLEKASKYGDDSNVMSIEDTTDGIYAAIKDLKEKSEEPPSSNPSSSEPSSDNSEPSSDSSKPKTDPTTSPTKAPSTKATRSPAQVTKDKNNAQKTMNQAKITSLKAKAKGKKKIVVSWKKVTKAVGYEVQVAKNNKFNKAIVDTFTNNVKLTIKNPKIKSKKTYFVRVRAYSTYKDANNKPQKVYSKWIKKTRKVKVK